MKRDYMYKKPLSAYRFYYVVNGKSPYSERLKQMVLQPAFTALRERHQITLTPIIFGEIPASPKGEQTAYVLYGPVNPLKMHPNEKAYLAHLSAEGCKTNVISAYPLDANGHDLPEYAAAPGAVRQLSRELHVNFPFPDDLNRALGVRTNDWQDIFANVLSETVRVKYEPRQSCAIHHMECMNRRQKEHGADIQRLSGLFAAYKLWQRDPASNGAVMFCSPGSWFCTQTMTDKTTMTAAHFDLVTGYDIAGNSLTYVGDRLPSSDAPEFIYLSELLKKDGRLPRMIVHFHHEELVRGGRFRELVTKMKIAGGYFAAGKEYYQALLNGNKEWFIMREHGVLWIGDTVDAFEAWLKRIVAVPKQA